MHNPSSSSYTDSLLELYATNRDRSSKGRSSDIVEVHDNGSPFQYSPNNNNNNNHSSYSPTSRRSSPKSNNIIGSSTSDILNYLNNSPGNNSNSSSKSKQTKKKKKVLGQNYHFIPMMGKKSKTYNNNSNDSDDSDGSSSEESDYEIGYDVYMNGRSGATNNTNDSGLSYGISSNGGMMNIHNNNDGQIMSDRDMLRDVFTTTATSSAVDQQQSLNEKQISNDTNNTSVRTTFGRRSDVGIAAEDNNDEKQLLLQNKNTAAAYNNNKLDLASSSSSTTIEQPFTSPLGQRIWSQYCTSSKNASPKRHEHQDTPNKSTRAIVCFKHLPSHDFLRLPPSIIQIQHYYGGENKTTTSTKTTEWVNIDELERRVMQHHLDLETMELTSATANNESPLMKDEHEIIANKNSSRSSTSTSSLITSECFTKVIERHPKIGLGMSLRIYDGCVYIHSLLRNDGSRVSKRERSCVFVCFVCSLCVSSCCTENLHPHTPYIIHIHI